MKPSLTNIWFQLSLIYYIYMLFTILIQYILTIKYLKEYYYIQMDIYKMV